MKFIRLIRCHHWIKNLLIFFPLFFAGNIFQHNLFLSCLLAFISFSFLSSAVYIFNDISDIEKDRLHAKKRKRPIASGAVSIKFAVLLAILLLFLACVINYFIGAGLYSWLAISLYFSLNILYSIALKNIPLLDITVLSSGFLIRLIYGGIASGVVISNWLYLMVIVFSFFMGFGKRRNEVRKFGGKSRKVLDSYSEAFLEKNMYMCATLSIVFYSLWCISYAKTNIIWTVLLIMLIIMKYLLNIDKNISGDPVEVLLNDYPLLGLVLLYGALMFGFIYI